MRRRQDLRAGSSQIMKALDSLDETNEDVKLLVSQLIEFCKIQTRDTTKTLDQQIEDIEEEWCGKIIQQIGNMAKEDRKTSNPCVKVSYS